MRPPGAFRWLQGQQDNQASIYPAEQSISPYRKDGYSFPKKSAFYGIPSLTVFAQHDIVQTVVFDWERDEICSGHRDIIPWFKECFNEKEVAMSLTQHIYPP